MGSDWLSLSKAAKLLGVHPSTVRAWSNKGLLPVHRTQGGHRRYRRDDILLWAETAHRPPEPESMMQMALKNMRLQIGEAHLQTESWYQKLDDEARAQYRLSARSLLQGLTAYLAAQGNDADSEAYAVGYEYASRARRYGLSYVDAAHAFLFFRSALIVSVLKVYGDANIPSGQAWQEILQRVHRFTDKILVSLLETYEALR